jgi:hypothetical protein
MNQQTKEIIKNAKTMSEDEFLNWFYSADVAGPTCNDLPIICELIRVLRDTDGSWSIWYFVFHNNLENYSLDEIITLWNLQNANRVWKKI